MLISHICISRCEMSQDANFPFAYTKYPDQEYESKVTRRPLICLNMTQYDSFYDTKELTKSTT